MNHMDTHNQYHPSTTAPNATGGLTGTVTTTAPKWNYCPNCGKKLCDEWNFCPSCGSTLSGWTYVAHPPSGDWGYMGGAGGWQWYPHLTPKCKSAQCSDNVARYQSTPPTK